MDTTTETTTRSTTRYWIVCDGNYATYTTSCKTEDDARAKANELASAGVNVLRIERQTMTTATTILDRF